MQEVYRGGLRLTNQSPGFRQKAAGLKSANQHSLYKACLGWIETGQSECFI